MIHRGLRGTKLRSGGTPPMGLRNKIGAGSETEVGGTDASAVTGNGQGFTLWQIVAVREATF